MATSGSSDFNLNAAEIIEEAFERCGQELRTGYDARTARRSLNLLFAEWANRGIHLWKVEQVTQTLAQLSTSSAIAAYPVGTITATVGASGSLSVGETITGSSSGTTASIITKPTATTLTLTVPSGAFTAAETITGSSSAATTTISADPSLVDVQSTIDILSAVIRRDSVDQQISAIGRAEYLHIPNKTTQGRASQFFFDRQITPTVTIWQVPENSTDQLIYNRFIRIQDLDTSVNDPDIPFRFLPCLVSGLAYQLALKFAPQLLPVLKAVYEENMASALLEDQEKVAYSMVPAASYLRVG
jgi:hypothetical protein|tara:strand:- start:666 stop:1568 length:903 start_codon:yes stop_codon:yes gene_type:complete